VQAGDERTGQSEGAAWSKRNRKKRTWGCWGLGRRPIGGGGVYDAASLRFQRGGDHEAEGGGETCVEVVRKTYWGEPGPNNVGPEQDPVRANFSSVGGEKTERCGGAQREGGVCRQPSRRNN